MLRLGTGKLALSLLCVLEQLCGGVARCRACQGRFLRKDAALAGFWGELLVRRGVRALIRRQEVLLGREATNFQLKLLRVSKRFRKTHNDASDPEITGKSDERS
jgi:hypothetical protein